MVAFVERENIGAGISFSRAIAGGLLARAYFGSAFLYSLFLNQKKKSLRMIITFFHEKLYSSDLIGHEEEMRREEIERKKNGEKRK